MQYVGLAEDRRVALFGVSGLSRTTPQLVYTLGCPVPEFRPKSAQISIRKSDKFRPNFEKDSGRNDMRARSRRKQNGFVHGTVSYL